MDLSLEHLFVSDAIQLDRDRPRFEMKFSHYVDIPYVLMLKCRPEMTLHMIDIQEGFAIPLAAIHQVFHSRRVF